MPLCRIFPVMIQYSINRIPKSSTKSSGPMTNNVEINIDESSSNAIRLWLLIIIGLIFTMVLVGGATRLTNSGLSITEWKPIMGAIPPLSEQDWQSAFDKYKAIPEYKAENEGMSLNEFKLIFWWEWSHRFLGRVIGLVFFLPMLFFWISGKLNRSLKIKLSGLFILGGLQGGLGWYMVKSGLVDRVDVSQYRLAAHLGLAVFIMAATYWVYLSLQKPVGQSFSARLLRVKLWGTTLVVAIFFQILLGALVAGIHAGKSHNTWPLMDGKLLPDGLVSMSPWYLNFFENVLTVQFDHRILAYAIFFLCMMQIYLVTTRMGEGRHLRSIALLFLAIVGQIALGVWTLLAHVPFALGIYHQAGAIIVLMVAITHLHSLYYPRKQIQPE